MIATGERHLAHAAMVLLAAIGQSSVTHAGTGETPELFASSDEIELTLALPLRTLLRQRTRRPEVEGTLSFSGTDGVPIQLDVEVTTRGHDRLENCAFPPLSLNFKRTQVQETLFAGQNRLKLVTLCRETSKYVQYLEIERLVYRIYEQLSDSAFRVRAARIRYVDSERGAKAREAPAFFIEPIDGVAERVGKSAVRGPAIARGELDSRALAMLTLFQFVIGNTDWSVTTAADGEGCCHNAAVLAPRAGVGGLVLVPYDFDHAGIVDAAYATPSELLGIRSVRERLYRGYCATNSYLDETIDAFNAAWPAIEALLETERLLPQAHADAASYLQRSHEIINDSESKQRLIVSRCRE